MKTREVLKMTLLVILMAAMLCMPSYASSLSDLQKQAQETTQAVEVEETSQSFDLSFNDSNNRSALANIAGAATLDDESETSRKIGAAMNSWAGKIMQVIGYVISIGLGIVTALDVCYIALPPLRSFLANGYVGTGDQQANANANGMSSMGSFGGMNSMGGMNRMGGLGNMHDRMEMHATQNNQPASGKTQWVTNAALNAVASATGGANPFKVYFKQQAIVCVMAPIIYVLAATGVLSQFGFMLGEALSNWIGNISL